MRIWKKVQEVSWEVKYYEVYCRIHISVSDNKGKVVGGHLKDGCGVGTTAEVVIGILEKATFNRILDKDTGFKELEIK